MAAILTDGYEIKQVAHPMFSAQHKRLASLRIEYSYTDTKPPKKLTCAAYAKAGICTPRERFLSAGGGDDGESADILVVVNEELWLALSRPEQQAVIDHALEHIDLDENGLLSAREHPIAEFPEIIKRHGLWNSGLDLAARVIRQLGAETVGAE